ncbi:MAG: FecR family protein, partial [Vulcanimicrobiota bacterium]
MRRFSQKKLMAALISAVLLITILPAVAQPKEEVARVVTIKGDRLDYSRDGGTEWFQAFVEMKDYKGDQLRTNASSYGSIEFYTGGQIGINKDTTIQIVSDDNADIINLEKGGLWGKLKTRPAEKGPVQIKTSSGVMGIRGTEFVINESDQGTEVSVLEGEVSVTPTGGEELKLTAGQKVYLDRLKGVETVNQQDVQTSDPKSLRKEILSSEEWEDFNQALSWARHIVAYVPGVGYSSEMYYAGRAINLVTDPEAALKREAESQINRGLGRYSPIGIGGLGLGGGSNKSKAPEMDFPTELRPDSQAEGSQAQPSTDLDFSWKQLKGVHHYYLLLARDDEMEDLVWTYETEKGATSVKYPEAARPLESGQYYWRVIGLDKNGEPVKKAA